MAIDGFCFVVKKEDKIFFIFLTYLFFGRSLLPGFLSSMVDSALKLPVTLERKLSRSEENGQTNNERGFGEFLRAVSTVSRKNSRREEEEEWEANFTREERDMEGLVNRC